MRLDKLYLEGFLSYDKLYLDFADGINVLVGQNAVGKTNLAESVYYCSVGKSARGLKDKELLSWSGADHARIRLRVERRFGAHTVDVYIDAQGKKRITVDELPIARIGELMGVVNAVYFSPDEMKLIKDSPADRRRFLDISLCQTDKVYFYKLSEYNKLLAQRNKLLKNYKDSRDLPEMSAIIVEKMADRQEYVVKKRKEFVEKIAPLAAARHRKITDGKEDLSLAYETEEIDFDDIKGSFLRLYEQNFEKDRRLEYTTVGCHRDDLKIIAGGIDVRKYGSQGQQRTAVLSLKLAEVDGIYSTVGEYPVVILDDVASELDRGRLKKLFESLSGVQVLVTTTEYDEDFGPATVFDVTKGKIAKRFG
ncbi:MAG: DNA replication/repair protein RecF [Clostridia bacterium]|nr:DNA replication/repair protein RecF [Clostridia bacterium]